jgi:hypothetical protein
MLLGFPQRVYSVHGPFKRFAELCPLQAIIDIHGTNNTLKLGLFLVGVVGCHRRLNIPQFAPVENSPPSPVEKSPGAV